MLLPLRMAASSFCQIWVRQCYWHEKMITWLLENCDFFATFAECVWAMVGYWPENLLRHKKKLPFFVRSISDFYIMTGLAKTLMFDMEGVFLGEVRQAMKVHEQYLSFNCFGGVIVTSSSGDSILRTDHFCQGCRSGKPKEGRVPCRCQLSLKLLETICIHTHYTWKVTPIHHPHLDENTSFSSFFLKLLFFIIFFWNYRAGLLYSLTCEDNEVLEMVECFINVFSYAWWIIQDIP